MTIIKLPYVDSFRDARGVVRYYFRRKRGDKRIVLPGHPGDVEFMRAYELARLESGGATKRSTRAPVPGSFDALATAYYQSAPFQNLSASTQATYKGIVERFRDTKGASGVRYGQNLVRQLTRRRVNEIIAAKMKASGPWAANNLLKVLRVMFTFALDNDWIAQDPTKDVKPIKAKTEGFTTWTEAHIEQFEAHHGSGTRARLALRLLLWTAQRRGDVVQMGRQHVGKDVNGDATIRVRQNKTKATLVIPMHRKLREEIAASATSNNLTFLLNKWGKPFSAAGFGNWFREVCDEAGLTGLSAHGLRKAAARRLAEAGCTPHQIQAITGHKSLAEVARYTIAANQERMAREAMDRIQEE